MNTYVEDPIKVSAFNCLDVLSPDLFDASVVDDKTLEYLYGIFDLLTVFKPGEYDEMRQLWFEVKNTMKRKSGCEEDKSEVLWYELLVRRYKHQTYLMISGRKHYNKSIADTNHAQHPREEWTGPRYDMRKALKPLTEYLECLVAKIAENVDAYNDYVDANLPYKKRVGRLERKKFYELFPERAPKIVIPDDVLRLLRKAPEDNYYDSMTLRQYAHYWCIGFAADRDLSISEDEEVEIFCKNQSRMPEESDWEGEEGFRRWQKESRNYHCHDIIYARLGLYAYPMDDYDLYDSFRNVKPGQWLLKLAVGEMYLLSDFMKIAQALDATGVKFVLARSKKIESYIRHDGYVELSEHSRCRVDWDNLIIEENYPDEAPLDLQWKLINLAEWDPVERMEMYHPKP